MSFRPAVVLLFTAVLLASPGTGRANAGSSLDATLARMDEAAAKFKTMSADIRKVSHTAVINEDNVESGTIYLRRPKPRDMRMLINLTKPDPKSVAVQGHKAEIYYPKINTVQEYDIGKSRELLDTFFLVGFGSSRSDLESAYNIQYIGADTVEQQKTAHLELTPKSKDVLAHLKKFDLWVADSGYPVQQKFFMPGGDYILATYSHLNINPPLSDAAVKLNLPKGVKREYPQK